MHHQVQRIELGLRLPYPGQEHTSSNARNNSSDQANLTKTDYRSKSGMPKTRLDAESRKWVDQSCVGLTSTLFSRMLRQGTCRLNIIQQYQQYQYLSNHQVEPLHPKSLKCSPLEMRLTINHTQRLAESSRQFRTGNAHDGPWSSSAY